MTLEYKSENVATAMAQVDYYMEIEIQYCVLNAVFS